MLTHNFTYEATLADSMKVGWQVNDIIGGDKRLDFSKPFMPETLAAVRKLSMLSPREQLLLNQIRGNSYLYMFGLVEEFILPFVTDLARASMLGDGDLLEVRALMAFADEEAKHIHLFRRFCEEFAAGFATPCGVIGPANEIAKVVLSHGRLGIALLILCIEWMTQVHYIDSVKTDEDLDPQFKSLLRHHWMEEAQHAKLDTLLVEKIARNLDPAAIEQGFADFAALGNAVDGLLAQQVQLDLDSLEIASGRKLTAEERAEITVVQHRSYRYTFLASGLVTKQFLATTEQLVPGGAERMRQLARALVA